MRFRQRIAVDSHLFKECSPGIVKMVGNLLDHSLRENRIILPLDDIHSSALNELCCQILTKLLVNVLILPKLQVFLIKQPKQVVKGFIIARVRRCCKHDQGP
ncbi:hypothetical protein DSECCO2_621880 [anaerobic digester metagenome]